MREAVDLQAELTAACPVASLPDAGCLSPRRAAKRSMSSRVAPKAGILDAVLCAMQSDAVNASERKRVCARLYTYLFYPNAALRQAARHLANWEAKLLKTATERQPNGNRTATERQPS